MKDEEESEKEITNKRELPTSIIIKNVPRELFEDAEMKANFSSLFTQIDPNVRLDYLKGFLRVRVVFTEPEHATAAKLLVEHHSFNGVPLKAYFAQNIKMIRKAHQDEEGHLKLPPLEKQFLISPPTSPPVGWTQSLEMAPVVVCDFDLMARLAAFTVEDNYELHEGDDNQPAIVVTPAGAKEVGGEDKEKNKGEEGIASDASPSPSSLTPPSSPPPIQGAKIQRPVTPRPPLNE